MDFACLDEFCDSLFDMFGELRVGWRGIGVGGWSIVVIRGVAVGGGGGCVDGCVRWRWVVLGCGFVWINDWV